MNTYIFSFRIPPLYSWAYRWLNNAAKQCAQGSNGADPSGKTTSQYTEE